MDFWKDPQFSLWEYTYLVLGLLFLAFSIFYVYKTIRATFNDQQNVQGKFTAQIAYIIAIFTKSICLIISAIFLFAGFANSDSANSLKEVEGTSNYRYLLEDKNNTTSSYWTRFQILPGAIPGYVSAVAYTLIFFSWCSICYDALEKNTAGFYKQIKIVPMVLVSMITGMFVISLILILALNSKILSMVEAIIAAIRDIIIAVCFIIYLNMISSLFMSLCPHICAPENRLFFLLILLIVALLLRPVCALVYNFVVLKLPNPPEQLPIDEFSYGYYIVFLIEFLLTEVMPLGMIGIIHLTSNDSYSQSQDNSVAAFLALD